MENYNIYDEIGRGTHSFVYKARRKRSIEYVAVKSTAKSRMNKILNEVQFLHKLDSPHVLKFFDWYESSNHIWLIFEYCMGGDLLNLITQDKQQPESTVQTFGLELVAGLQYLHSNSILFCDLKPANILIDECGSLKLADFGLARRIPGLDAAPAPTLAPGSPHYMAPELFQQPAIHSFASDFWALGCVLYELRTGRQPFTHTNFSDLARMIQKETVDFSVAGSELSPTFRDLLQRLLTKDPYQRITWDELVDHPFWSSLPRLEKLAMPRQIKFDSNAPMSLSEQTHIHATSNNFKVNSKKMRPGIKDYKDNNMADENRGDHSRPPPDPKSDIFFPVGIPSQDEIRPISAPTSYLSTLQNNSKDVDENHDAILNVPSHLSKIRQHWKAMTKPYSAPPATRDTSNRRPQLNDLFDRSGLFGTGLRKISKLVFTAADCRVKSIIGNNDFQVEDLPRIRADLVQFTLFTPEDLLSCSTEALETQLKDIYMSLKSSQDLSKLSVLAYLFTLSCHARLAHVIVNSSLLKLLIRLLAQEAQSSVPNKTTISMLCLVLGILFRFATFIAPSSLDQFQLLVTSLSEIVSIPDEDPGFEISASSKEMQPRSLALACLGELLFYISTQHEWELPMEGVETVLACIEDTDVAARFYTIRTLGNMLIHCTDSLILLLVNENIVLTLMRGLLQLATPMSSDDVKEQRKRIALQTATTEALAQVLRHLRLPSSNALLPSRLKRSILLFFAKPDLLHAIWRGVQCTQEFAELAIASLNIINAFLDLKLSTNSDAESAAIKASRSLLLDRIVVFPTMLKILELGTSLDNESLTIMKAKVLILLHLGVHSNRSLLHLFVQQKLLDIVESIVNPIEHELRADKNDIDSQSPESKLSASKQYLAQCALNVCKLSIRMALKLGAVCFSMHSSIKEDQVGSSNNGEHRSYTVSPIPFELFSDLLRNPNCRQQLLTYFVANDSKQYTFFLRLMTELLMSFSDETIVIPWKTETTRTIAQHVSEILLALFKHGGKEANDIVFVEQQVLFGHLLPAVVKHINGTSAGTRENVSSNCLCILHVVLLEFDYQSGNHDKKSRDVFTQSILIPHINALFANRHGLVERIWTLVSQLLHGLLSTDPTLLQQVESVNLVPTIVNLLRVPDEFHSLPLHATQLVHMLLDSSHVNIELLHKSGLAKSVIAGLTFAFKRELLDESLLDLVVILLTLLHQQHENMQQLEPSTTLFEFDEILSCGQLLLQFCAWSGKHMSCENKSDENRRRRDELADVTSRCLLLLSQISGEQLNEIFFRQNEAFVSNADDFVSTSLTNCLQGNMNGVVLLRVLLTLKNCLSYNTSSHLSRWVLQKGRISSMIETLVPDMQTIQLDEAQNEMEPEFLSVKEKILNAATAITHLCRSSDSR
ncbi:putative protein kinase [Plasmopara halstedii]